METTSLLILSGLAGLITAVLGVIITFLSRRQSEDQKKLNENAAKLADAIAADAAASRARALEMLTEKLPEATCVDDLVKTIEGVINRQDAWQNILSTTSEMKDGVSTDKRWPIVERLIDGYHRQALSQAKIQFWFSVAAATVGFSWIMYAATTIEPSNFATYLTTLPGVIIDAVAVLFFKQAEDTRQRATELYDRLRDDNRDNQSILMVKEIPDEQIKSITQAQIALHMAGIQTESLDLNSILVKLTSKNQG